MTIEMMLLAEKEWMLLTAILIFLVPVGLAALLSLWALKDWLRANAAGLDIKILEIGGMKLRRVDVNVVIDAMIVAANAGVLVSQIDVQRAYQAGVDPRKIVQALLRSRDKEESISFEQLVKIELQSQSIRHERTESE